MPATALPLEAGVKELRTVEPSADVPAVVESGAALMFERLARDPSVDVDKLERLIAMQERIISRNAKAEFYADFAEMQALLPTVMERGQTNNGFYATHEDIVEAVRPALKQFGFMLTFRTKFPDPTTVQVVGVLAHRSGHAEETEFISKADTSGSKNAIQALGSAQSYGQRYTTRALLNIASRKDDDDGRKAGGKPEPETPAGYDDWLTDFQSKADEGFPALQVMWKASKKEFTEHLQKTAPKLLASIKAKATKVQS